MKYIVYDDLQGEPVDEEKLERAMERMRELYDIETETLPNGNTVTVMKTKGGKEVGRASGASIPIE